MAGTAIVVDQLTKRFGSVTALDRVGFAVPAGTVFGLLGPNGAGKTTAIRILTTLLRPDDGTATVLGLEVVRDAAAVRHQIGLARRCAAVDEHLTGRENLRLIGRLAQLPRAEFRPCADQLLTRFGLAVAASRPVRTYSGGMRRRLDVAAALVARPPVLFLDEPATGLDLPSRNELWAVIRELVADGTTVVLTTQYLEEADRLTDRLVVIEGGMTVVTLPLRPARRPLQPQPQRHPPYAQAADIFHHPAAGVPRAVPVRVRRGGREDTAVRAPVRRLPDARHLRPGHRLRRHEHRHRAGRGPADRPASSGCGRCRCPGSRCWPAARRPI
ncbi:ABC transporter ATP-binding protein [Trebonia sp.]|uniref:ABC transporter ATP-binding protein n=1 Tax=Trebonia sp. TaxID=2767075 RepID=UPI00260A7925|nr:ATP-binding cassette domain-containing protein [Trebonia sp.]